MAEDRTDIEERLAHLLRAVDDLSDVVAGQARRIEVLERRVAALVMREAEREAQETGGEVAGDTRPPHW